MLPENLSCNLIINQFFFFFLHKFQPFMSNISPKQLYSKPHMFEECK